MPELGKKLISPGEMLPLIVSRYPSFKPLWRKFHDEWKIEKGDPPYTLALGDLARHLIEELDRGQTSTFPEIFNVIEDLHVHGDGYVREAATVGLLEAIQNLCGGDTDQGRLKAKQFEKWLGPESLRQWHRLHDFWDGDPTALHDD